MRFFEKDRNNLDFNFLRVNEMMPPLAVDTFDPQFSMVARDSVLDINPI